MKRTRWVLVVFLSALLVAMSSCRPADPTVPERLSMASRLMEEGQPRAALDHLERADAEIPDLPEVLELMAFAYASLGDGLQAGMTFLRLAQVKPEAASYFLFAAEAFRGAGQASLVSQAYRQYLEALPEDHAVWRSLGDFEVESGRPNAAVEAFTRSHRLREDPAVALKLGDLFSGLGNRAQARLWLGRAAEAGGPVRGPALLGLLRMALLERRPLDAETIVRSLDQEFPGLLDGSDLAGSRAELRVWRERQDAAVREAEALAARAQAEREAEREAKARAQAEEEERQRLALMKPEDGPGSEAVAPAVLIGEEPRSPGPARTGVAGVLSRADQLAADAARHFLVGEVEDAVGRMRESLALDDRSPLRWAELSRFYLAQGRSDWAEVTALEAMRRDPADPRWAVVYLEAARLAQPPRKFLEIAVGARDRFPRSPDLTLILARAYRDLAGNRRNAAFLFREWLEMVPNAPEAAGVRAELQDLGVIP